MNVIIFGIGLYYQNRKERLNELLGDYNLIAFADNRANEVSEFESNIVIMPNLIIKYKYDAVIVMSKQFDDIKEQLLAFGVSPEKIFSFEKIECYSKRGKYQLEKIKDSNANKRVLFITTELGFNGASFAVLYASKALISRGYGVCVATSTRHNLRFKRLLQENGIEFLECASFPYIGGDDFRIIQTFDVVISNVLQTVFCAKSCSERLPTIWWLHESDSEKLHIFRDVKNTFYECNNEEWMKNARLLAVSNLAKKSFESNYKKTIDSIIPPGQMDWSMCPQNDEVISFYLIAHFMENKGQLLFVDAIAGMKKKEKVDYSIIGADVEKEYACKVKSKCVRNGINVIGEKSSYEIRKLYERIDVVVCASYMETLSLTIIEGMMNSKIVITTDNTGIAEYIEDGVNGFICKAGDVESLRDKMEYVIDHFDELDDMRKKARQTYEKYFTLEILGENLEREINIAVEEFSKKHKTPSPR